MHSTHAHPLPDGRNTSSSQAIGLPNSSSAITLPSTLASQQQSESINDHTRRLHLRNAGFRGAFFPTRRISPLFATSSNSVESFSRQISLENSSLNAEKRSMYGEDLPPSPVNILQEIQRSTRKKRTSPRPGFGAIFQDNTQTQEVNGASETSWYEERSRNCSPTASAATPINMMKLREVSGNQMTPLPPLSSPLTKQVKGRNVKRINLRSASSEASKYIEHLESQLASVNAKLDSLMSPNTNKLRSAKLRALTVDNRNLRQDLSAWEKQFAARVKEERDQFLEVEMELKTRLRVLENEMELKDARIAELEWETESMRVKVGDAQGLEEVNIGLEKRIETLTNLLVQSSTPLDMCSAAISPVTDPIKRTPRPKSMLPKIPSPSAGLRLSLSTVSESAFWRPSTIESSSGVVSSLGNAGLDEDGQDLRSPSYDEGMRSSECRRQSRQSGYFESRSRRSGSFRSAPSSASRPTSFRSNGSFGPTSWGLPHLAEADVTSANKQRKMRKFPSGSVSLRPLILPAATVVPSLPASAPIYPSIEATARQKISEVPLDPTRSILSKPLDSSPVTTPDQDGRQRSTSWAQEQTLKTLEGRFVDVEHLDDDLASPSIVPTTEEIRFGLREVSSEDPKRRSRPRSLQKELEQAAIEQAKQAQNLVSYELFEDGLIPVDMDARLEGSPESGEVVIGIDATPSKASSSSGLSRRSRLLLESVDSPKLEESPALQAYASSQPVKAFPSTSLTNQHAFGIFSRLTSLISQTKQDPLVLARRLLSNAWAKGSKRLGGMGWWLLVEPTNTQDFDWPHFTAEASRSRTAEYYFRDYGTCHRKTEPWLSPPHGPAQQLPLLSDSTPPPPPTSPVPRRNEPHLFPCNDCVEPSSRRTLRLWFRFSLAIVLAVGMAIKHGPASLLSEDPDEPHLPTHAHEQSLPQATDRNAQTHAHEREPLLQQAHRSRSRHHHHRHRDGDTTEAGRGVDDNISPSSARSPRVTSVPSSSSNGRVDSGYGSITFAETLGPADFEAIC